ncbi:unnamed protein product [Phytomonas sp. EM1]|nr:unnamed protein product [Phytomonas sp. EM1]|eukprot:CCW59768.1 unnamed protein product [Phytomonas sp. isolate EM1]
MKRLVDVFGEEAPSWLMGLLAKSAPDLTHYPCEFLTARQLRQLSSFSSRAKPDVTGFRAYPFLLVRPFVSGSEVAAVCLTHGRTCRFVSLTRGDVVAEADPHAPFLSCRGLALTKETKALLRLEGVQTRKGYTSRFWLSDAEFRLYSCSHHASQLRLKFMDSTALAELFNSDASVEVVNDRGCTCRVVNFEEIQEGPFSERASRIIFHLFRQFCPLNVRTCKPFEHSIEDQLRLESFCSDLWCSVWGTLQDFEACSIKPLEGALGLYVMDPMGNEIFLTNAFRTENPLRAFARVYPDNFITFVD